MTARTSRIESGLAWALRPFVKVAPSEAITALAMTLTVFLLLTAYYLLKTAREPLILLHGGAEVKSYASAGQALILLGVVRAYGALAKRVGRMKLLAIVYGFFIANIVVFAALLGAGAPIGVVFFLWVGVFNMTAVAQFWALAADIYTNEQGKRLLAVLGIGSSTGAMAGSWLAAEMVSLGPEGLMVAAAAILFVCLGLFAWIDRRERASAERAPKAEKQEPIAGDRVFRVLLRDKYLLLLGALALVLNCVNKNGEYIIDRTLLEAAAAAKEKVADPNALVIAFNAD
jgi:ATP:ADP antiporter, AAA family